jgi:molecular chaperone GrpE
MSQEQKNAGVVDDATLELPEPAETPAELAAQPAEELPVVQDTLAELQNQLQQTRAKVEENWGLYLSARAEVENIRKRSEREIQNARKFALKDFVDALLPVKDSLESGITVANEIVDVNKLREGSELTLKMLGSVLERFGVQEVNPIGAKFNPEFHEAMAMQPSDQAEPNTVLYVVQKGYLLNDRLIRPARVIVAYVVQQQSEVQAPLSS